ncbi:MAG: hypothetical protein GY750_17675 [Lentisphaerae bacterium]|nr:hypothetical protein [Lentisphaerota bacterium]MCP4103229.1 hypothetical protein [Lentisphaerota bacterium]
MRLDYYRSINRLLNISGTLAASPYDEKTAYGEQSEHAKVPTSLNPEDEYYHIISKYFTLLTKTPPKPAFSITEPGIAVIHHIWMGKMAGEERLRTTASGNKAVESKWRNIKTSSRALTCCFQEQSKILAHTRLSLIEVKMTA